MQLLKDIEIKLRSHPHSYWTPGSLDLKSWSQEFIIPNRDNIPVFHTKVRARMVEETIQNVNEIDDDMKAEVEKVVNEAYENLMNRDIIVVERSIGTSTKTSLKFRLYIPKNFPQLALMTHRGFFGSAEDKEIDFCTISIPDFPKKMTIVDPETNTTFILGSDYYGEHKMSFLRLGMQLAREKMGSLGLHAGSKEYWVKDESGEINKKGVLIFGLSGTGKTTITTMSHKLVYPERVRIRQDDITIINEDMYCSGTERNLYIKTDSLMTQEELLSAAMNSGAIIENVPVKYGGYAFDDIDFCENGRALVPRYAIPHTDSKIDLDKVDIIFFNTRRFDLPIAGRLVSAEQAATFFMLGESTQTSAGTENKEEVGKPMRVVGFDPFITPPIEKNGQILYEIMKKNPNLKVYILNTGMIGGPAGEKIGPQDTGNTVLQIVKGTVEWKYDENVGYEIPTSIPGTDLDRFDPYKHYSADEYAKIMKNLREERLEYLSQFDINFAKLTK